MKRQLRNDKDIWRDFWHGLSSEEIARESCEKYIEDRRIWMWANKDELLIPSNRFPQTQKYWIGNAFFDCVDCLFNPRTFTVIRYGIKAQGNRMK